MMEHPVNLVNPEIQSKTLTRFQDWQDLQDGLIIIGDIIRPPHHHVVPFPLVAGQEP
jgi:hypothetical protein